MTTAIKAKAIGWRAFEHDDFAGEYTYTRPDGIKIVVGQPPTDARHLGWTFAIHEGINKIYGEGWLDNNTAEWRLYGPTRTFAEVKALALSAVNTPVYQERLKEDCAAVVLPASRLAVCEWPPCKSCDTRRRRVDADLQKQQHKLALRLNRRGR